METAVFGGGCFWCVEAAFEMLKGVEDVISGYAGGDQENPTYEQVCRGETNHAEVVQITYNAKKVSYEDLMRVFFTIHDPTTIDRQGNDVGPQYRSIILFNSEEQKNSAKKMIDDLERAEIFENRIVTEVKELKSFYKAEEYHQDFYAKHPEKGYCQLVIRPKLEKLEEIFKK